MRVLHVIPSVGPARGGPSFVMRSLARGLAASGVEVHVASTDDNGRRERLSVPLSQPVAEDGVTYWYFPCQTRFYQASLPLTRWLWRESRSFDLVHIHALFSYSSSASGLVALSRGVPYVIRPLGILNRWGRVNRRPFLKNLSFQVLERRLVEGARAMHYTSRLEREEAEEWGFAAPAAIIPNPVSFDDLPEVAGGGFRAKHGLGERLLVLFLSRIDDKKGLDLLIPAFARFRKRYLESTLVIAGSGSEALESSLRKLAEEHAVTDSILWTGFVEGRAKAELLRDADVFVLPSYSENFGVAAVEAMGLGLPLIVSDQVGICGEIEAAGAGAVVRCEVTALAAEMERLAGDAALRGRMGEQGRKLALEEYSLGAVCGKMLGLYRQVLGE
ncbi:MAG: glycosyltransferase [Bryobacteraceae bacterium]|nr:glycosyltransferase [Bryobacteraceae bacterium]